MLANSAKLHKCQPSPYMCEYLKAKKNGKKFPENDNYKYFQQIDKVISNREIES